MICLPSVGRLAGLVRVSQAIPRVRGITSWIVPTTPERILASDGSVSIRPTSRKNQPDTLEECAFALEQGCMRFL